MKPSFPFLVILPLAIGCATPKTAAIIVPIEESSVMESLIQPAKQPAFVLKATQPSPAWEMDTGSASGIDSSDVSVLFMRVVSGPARDPIATFMAAPVPRVKKTPYDEALMLAEMAGKSNRESKLGAVEPKNDPNQAGFRNTVMKDGAPFMNGLTRVLRVPGLEDRWVAVFASWRVEVDEEVTKDVEDIIASFKLVSVPAHESPSKRP